jgi:hypothetical protein
MHERETLPSVLSSVVASIYKLVSSPRRKNFGAFLLSSDNEENEMRNSLSRQAFRPAISRRERRKCLSLLSFISSCLSSVLEEKLFLFQE